MKMARPWAKLDIDMKVLKLLLEMKSLHGVAIAKMCDFDQKKMYVRLHAMKKRKLIEGVTYKEINESLIVSGRGVLKKSKKATLYYLTVDGIKIIKDELGYPCNSKEYSMRPEEEQFLPIYYTSMLVANIDASYCAGKDFRVQKDIPNFIPIDIVANNHVVIIERLSTQTYRKTLIGSIKGVKSNLVGMKMLVLCPSMYKGASSARQWNIDYGSDALFADRNNYEIIEKIINDQTMPAILQSLAISKGPVQKLPELKDGCGYKIGEEYCNVIDFVGCSPKSFRKIKHGTAGVKTYIGIESIEFLKIVASHFQDILSSSNEFITLTGTLIESKTVRSMYLRKGA
jgi:hypothetical protein